MFFDTLENRCLLSFQPGVRLPAFDDPIRNAIEGDFNRDGNLDLAVVTGTGEGDAFDGVVTVLMNRGDGTFTKAIASALSDEPTTLAVGNFDFGRQLDLVLSTSDGAAVLLGNGNGTFSSRIALSAHEAEAADNGNNLAVGDFNGDGRLDVATSGLHFVSGGEGATESQIAIFLGIGNGTFFGPVVTRIAGDADLGLATVRANNDRIADLAVGARNQVKLLTGKGDGTFNFPSVLGAQDPTFLRTADVNSDGRMDLLYQDRGETFFALARRRSRGFADPRRVNPSSPVAAVGDFDGDRFNDLLLSPTTTDSRILEGRPGGQFQLTTSPVRVDPGLPGVVGDFNGDGRDDVLSANLQFLHFATTPPVFVNGGGTLVVNGTRRSDGITISRDDSTIVVVLRGRRFEFGFFDVNDIRIAGGHGNDVITVDTGLNKNVFAAGGAGDDRITGGAGNDTLAGGDGNDILVGGLGNDLLQGDAGNDDVDGGVGTDAVFGGTGLDRFHLGDNASELKDKAPGEPVVV